MHIMHVITRLIRAGADENTVLSCIGQAQKGHQVTLVHGRDFDRSFYRVLEPSVRVICLPKLVRKIDPLADSRALGELSVLMRTMKPDIVHTHTSKAGILGRVAAARAGVASIVHGIHIAPFLNEKWPLNSLYVQLERMVAKRTHAFINVSNAMMKTYLDAGIGARQNHWVVHSGFDIEKFRTAARPDDWRDILGLEEGAAKPPVVLMLAALESRKQHLHFLEIVPQILRDRPEAVFVFAGDGSRRQAIEAKVQAMDLGRNVKVLGLRTDPEKLIALADVCVLTSRHEGLPRVLMQYMCGGRATVTFDLPGVSEIVRDGHNGLIADIGDFAGVASAVGGLLADDVRRREIAARAAATDLSSWAVGAMCEQLDGVYRSIMRGSNDDASPDIAMRPPTADLPVLRRVAQRQ